MIKIRRRHANLSIDVFTGNISIDPLEYSILPKPLAAEMCNKSQPWVADKIREKVFDELNIVDEEGRYITRAVTLISVLNYLEEKEEEDSSIIKSITNILIDTAKKHGIIQYAELMNKVGLSSRIPNDRAKIGELLGKISEESYLDSRIMLSALAVLKKTKKPNDSFYYLAEGIGHHAYDKYDTDTEFWDEEIRKIYKMVDNSEIKKVK